MRDHVGRTATGRCPVVLRRGEGTPSGDREGRDAITAEVRSEEMAIIVEEDRLRQGARLELRVLSAANLLQRRGHPANRAILKHRKQVIGRATGDGDGDLTSVR